MSYRIIGDSCLDLTDEQKRNPHFRRIPLTLHIDDHTVIDDDTFDQQAFIRMLAESPSCPRSACPSPETFKQAYECEEDDVYVITLSSHLSGSYNSARLGKELYEEEHGPKNILVLDSESASSGQVGLALAIERLCEQGLSFPEVSEQILTMRDRQKTYFVIDSLEPLRKNGRLTGLQAFFATSLNIKPVMAGDHGVIVKRGQTRGLNRAYSYMCDLALREAGGPAQCHAVIAHCNCPDRALQIQKELLRRGAYREIIITETAGVATMYAGDGGIVLALISDNALE
ncbi:MAG: DegV family protein [Clostridiales bacterium]|nr:DegV family protein [Clostridiales bacterium]